MKYIIMAAVSFIACSCAGDLGNYEYKALPEPLISNIYEEMSIMAEDVLTIVPVIEGGMDEDAYEYSWKAVDRGNDMETFELGNEKTLNYTGNILSPGTYSLYFTMTEKESGVFWQKVSTLIVSTSMSEGWMVLCEKDSKPQLNFISKITDNTIIYDVLADKGLTPNLLGAPRKILWMISTNGDKKDTPYLLTETGATSLDPEAFAWQEQYDMKYEMFSRENVTPYSIARCGYGKMMVSGTDAYYCEDLDERGGLYGASVSKGMKASPFIGVNIFAENIFSALYLLYVHEADGTGGRFMVYCPNLTTEGVEKLMDFEALEQQLSSGSLGSAFDNSLYGGKQCVYMENTKYNLEQRSSGMTYVVLKGENTVELFGIQLGDLIVGSEGSSAVECNFVLNKSFHKDISSLPGIMEADNLFAFSSGKSYMYYAKAGSGIVRQVDLSQDNLSAVELPALDGEKITCLKFNMFKDNEDTRLHDLIIGSENASGEGIVRIYEGGFNAGGDFSSVEPVIYTGDAGKPFGKVVDVTYKERN